MFFHRKRVKIAVFETSEDESRLLALTESLAVHGRKVSLNGSPGVYVVEQHDADLPEALRVISIKKNEEGTIIRAANYADLVEGALLREDIKYGRTEEVMRFRKWRRVLFKPGYQNR